MPKKSKRKAKPARKKSPSKVSPIPTGMQSVIPYLVISGAAQAMEFYKKAFGAKEVDRSPLPDGRLMNATMKIGDSVFMISDEFPGSGSKSPSSAGNTTVTIHLYSKNVDKLWQQAVDAGAKAALPLENQFWGERFGVVTDPFGHRWSMSMRVKMDPKEMKEKERQAMAMFSQGDHPSKTEQPSISSL